MRRVYLSVALALCLGTCAYAQENRFELGASATGNFLKQTRGNGVRYDANDKAGVGASFRYWLTGRQGIDVSWSHVNLYNSYSRFGGATNFKTYMNEATASYVLRLPTFTSKLQPFALAGGGALLFTPNGTTFGSTVAKPAFTYGGGVDAMITRNIGFRAQYKGFFFGAPNAGVSSFTTNEITHMAQPSAGLFWKF